MPDSFLYPGEELHLFEKALHWKKYFSSFILPYINDYVLEAGAGLGANTVFLNTGHSQRWLLLEPDMNMKEMLQSKLADGLLPANCKVAAGTIQELNPQEKFDSIIYIDVLEHIKEDGKEMQLAAELLVPGGHLIVLSPAFDLLFSRFDKEIGHYRRYTKSSLQQIIPRHLLPVHILYLDSIGFFLSLMNRWLLHQKYPTARQVNFWDRYIMFFSRIADKIVYYSFGKTILGVWKKPVTEADKSYSDYK